MDPQEIRLWVQNHHTRGAITLKSFSLENQNTTYQSADRISLLAAWLRVGKSKNAGMVETRPKGCIYCDSYKSTNLGAMQASIVDDSVAPG